MAKVHRLRHLVATCIVLCPCLLVVSCGSDDTDDPSGSGGSVPSGDGDGDLGGAAGAPWDVSDLPQHVEPLDDHCDEDVCHVVLRLDAQTLNVLGYVVSGSNLNEVNLEGASTIAKQFFEDHDEELYAGDDSEVSEAEAGVYVAFIDPGDFGAFALVGEASGSVLAGGGVHWEGLGSYASPSSWRPAGDIEVGRSSTHPKEEAWGESSESCDREDKEVPSAPASEALGVALRSNLARHLADNGDFSAFTYLYAPTVGSCDPDVAEYLVVLTQVIDA